MVRKFTGILFSAFILLTMYQPELFFHIQFYLSNIFLGVMHS